MIKSKMRWAGHEAQMEARGMHIGYCWEGKGTLRWPRRRWADIKLDLKEIGLGGMDWTDLSQDRIAPWS